jgi:hypothetical protein
MEPAEAVLKGKPHAFESWSGHLPFYNSLQFSPHSLRYCCTWGGDIGSIGTIKPLIPAALFSLTYLLTILDLINKRKVKCYPYPHTPSVTLIVSEVSMVTDEEHLQKYESQTLTSKQ